MSEIKYIKEKQYLQKLYSEYADKKPHLVDVLDPQDPQTSYLLEGFAFYLRVYRIKLTMHFLKLHCLLQRLDSQAIKGFQQRLLYKLTKVNCFLFQ